MSQLKGRTVVAVSAIVLLAAAARFWALGFGLPHTNARPDETAIIDTARSFLRGDFRPHFYDYPWVQMWLVAGLDLAYFAVGRLAGWFSSYGDFLASWPIHWEPFFLIPRALTATLGTATVLVVFWIGRRLWDESTGLVAAVFMALAYIHVRDSHYSTTDVPMTFFTVLSVALLLDAHLRRRAPIGAALAAGLATATKYGGVILALPLAISYLAHVIDARGARLRAILDRHLWGVALAFLVAFAVGVPFVVLDHTRFMAAMRLLQDSMVKGQGVVPVEPGWMHHLRLSLRYGIGSPLLVAGTIGALGLLIRTPLQGLLLFSFPLAYFVVAASVDNLFFRYVIPIVPFLCLTAAWLVSRIGDTLTSRWSARPEVRLAFIAVVSLAVIWPSAANTWTVDELLGRTDNRVVLARWFADHVPEGSSVVQSGSQYGHAQFEQRLHYAQWIWNRAGFFEIGRTEAVGRPDWIVIQDSPLPSATQSMLLEFLREDYALVQRFDALTLPPTGIYDSQDAFFLPLAGFDGVKRPGPNFTVYQRRGAAFR